jgi:hypothetical protein
VKRKWKKNNIAIIMKLSVSSFSLIHTNLYLCTFVPIIFHTYTVMFLLEILFLANQLIFVLWFSMSIFYSKISVIVIQIYYSKLDYAYEMSEIYVISLHIFLNISFSLNLSNILDCKILDVRITLYLPLLLHLSYVTDIVAQ